MIHLKWLVKTGLAALVAATLGGFSFPARAATVTVTNLSDSGPGSLRAAIAAASPGDTINFAVTGTITLTGGPLVITTGLTISGPGPANLAISGNNVSAVFSITMPLSATPSPVSISGLTIENGSSGLNGGGIGFNSAAVTLAVVNCTFSNNSATNGSGGGIYLVSGAQGTLTVTNSSFSSNTSGGSGLGGGAIFVANATLTVTNSSFSSNTSVGFGGAIDVSTFPGSTSTVTNSTFSNNTAGQGGGIFATGDSLIVTDSTFSGNSASGGGAMWLGGFSTSVVINSTFSGNSSSGGGGAIEDVGPVSVSNSTFSNNTAAIGGGAIENVGGASLAVSNSTFSGNSAPSGGAVFNFGIAKLKNSLFAKGASGGNCFDGFQGALTSEGHNLSDDASCAAFFTQTGDLNDTPAGLDPAGLKNNGGPTQTIALLPTSPAVDAIPVGACTDTNGNPVATDQRGVPRPQGFACDIGAFELVPTQSTATTVVASPTTITLGDTVTFTATVTTATGTPTGLVTLFDGSTPLGSGTLTIVAGQSQASFSTSLLSAAASPHSVTAVYQGDATHTGSASSAASETVNPRTSTSGVVLAPNTVVVGQPSTATVTVTDSGSVPPGTADTFTPTGAATTGRSGFTSTLFADGLVLVAGGTDANNNVLSSAEIYSVSGAAFSATGNLKTARTGAVAVLLPNGKVLVAGGSSNGLATGALNTAELFDPSAGTFTTSSTNMAAARFGATATLLNTGKVLIAGGQNASGTVLNTAELYDPVADNFTATGNLNAARTGHSATLLGTSTNAKVLIAGGSSDGTANGALNSGELFDPTGNSNAGTFTLITGANSTLSANRWQPQAALLLSGKVLIAGGQNSGGALASADVYDPVANTFTSSNHSMAQARANGSALLLPNGMVLLAGGTTGQAVDLYDADSDQFDATGSLQQSDNGLVSVLLNNGQVLVVGLTTAATPASDAELYTPSFNPLGTVSLSSSEATDGFGSACVLAPNTSVASTCSSTVTPVNVATSPHTITETYPADPVHSGSNSTANLVLTAAASTLTVSGYASPVTAGTANSFTVTAKDTFGNTTPTYTGTVHFTSSDGQAVLPADYTFVAADNGTHTFSATLKTAGTQSITTTDTVTATITGTETGITVNPAGTSTLAVAGYPSPVTAGTANSFTVTAKDAFGNTTPAYTGTVHFTSSDGQAVLPANYTFVAADNSTHTFSATLKTAGTQSITATDTVTATITGAQSGITVTPASTTTTVISPSNPSVFGQAVTFTATITDSSAGSTAVPTGAVQFVVDGVNFGSPVALTGVSSNSSTATSQATATLSVAGSPHTVTANYVNADGNFSNSTGALTGGQTVAKADTTTTLTSSQNPSILGQSVTFTATVSAVAPGAGSPTGNITFSDGATTLATVSLNSAGTAAFSTSTLAVNSHSITAAYSGDGNFNASSGSLTQKVSYSIIVLYDQSRAVNGGATFPIKVALYDANGVDVSSSTIVVNAKAVTMASAFSGTPDSPGNANPDNDFRFDGTLGANGGYIFNLSTGGLASGSYSLQFTAGADPVLHTVMFGVAP